MNAERLLAQFERISEAPDAIPRLRRFILDLAVRGKLVEQDPEDEPAEMLLARILAAKPKKVTTSDALLGSTTDGELLREMPKGWTPASFEDYSLSVNTGPFGSTLPQSEYIEGGIPLVNPSHMKDQAIVCDPRVSVSEQTAVRLCAYRLSAGDLVIARRGEVGRVALVGAGENGWICGTGSFFASFHQEVPRDYLLLFMQSSLAREFLGNEGIGATMTNLNQKILKKLPIPLPPLAEQPRIVAKVDELMALCDQLEAARQERQQHQQRLVAASLQRLNQPAADPDTFRQQAGFTLKVLPRLTTTAAEIKQLRQTILNLAVRGKLVEQDPEELSEAFYRGYSSLAKPCELIPETWLYLPLASLLKEDSRNGYSRKPDNAEDGTPILRISAGTAREDGLVAEEEFKLIGGVDEGLMAQFELMPGDLLACRFNGNKSFVGRLSLFVGYLGIRFIYPDKLI